MSDAPSGNVLLVEDNPANVRLFSMLLEKKGYTVVLAGTAEDGIEAAREHLPDLIIMDLQLPGQIDGVEATRTLKAEDATKHIPIVVVSAHAFKEVRDAARAAGCDDFLTKPVLVRPFLMMVERHLPSTASA
ncbi:MAG: response regulator [Acidobacteriota bacterium]